MNNQISGIINILKPPGMTSFDVVKYLRYILKVEKIGHTGTLDPGAVGVLPVCMGRAARAVEYMINCDKVYRAELTLGITTDTQDRTGEIVEIRKVDKSVEQLRQVMGKFVGNIRQVPPMYSALKKDGKKLYELARSGISIERQPRDIVIYSINIIDILENKIIFDAACSKGTYIRTLCADIGEQLGCGGHMSFLVRLKAGFFNISSAITLEEIAKLVKDDRLHEIIIKVDTVFKDFNSVLLNEVDEKKLINGGLIKLDSVDFAPGETVRAYNRTNQFLALCIIISRHNGHVLLKSKKLFM